MNDFASIFWLIVSMMLIVAFFQSRFWAGLKNVVRVRTEKADARYRKKSRLYYYLSETVGSLFYIGASLLLIGFWVALIGWLVHAVG